LFKKDKSFFYTVQLSIFVQTLYNNLGLLGYLLLISKQELILKQ